MIARQPTITYWHIKSMDVIRSFVNTTDDDIGTKAVTPRNGTLANGATVAAEASSAMIPANAVRRAVWPAGSVTSTATRRSVAGLKRASMMEPLRSELH